MQCTNKKYFIFDIAMNNLRTGKEGEELAVKYLQQQGYTILERNWRWHHVEIDVIAYKEKVLHIIEVKTRKSLDFGQPEEAVNKGKIAQLKKGAEEYQYRHPEWQEICFDVLAITLRKGTATYWMNTDVYF